MQTKEEICKDWESALEHIRSAEKMMEDGSYQEVNNQIDIAVLTGINAIKKLAEELKSPALKDTALIVFDKWAERAKAIYKGNRHPAKKETIELGFILLKRLYDEVPLGALKPLK